MALYIFYPLLSQMNRQNVLFCFSSGDNAKTNNEAERNNEGYPNNKAQTNNKWA